MSMYHSYLSVVVACHIQIFAVYIRGKETASHSIDIYAVDSLQITVFVASEYSNAFIFNRIEKKTVLGEGCVRRIPYFYFAPFCESSFSTSTS